MALEVGLVGLPNAGKSTLFNAITQAGAETANFPFCTIDPNVGVVPVPDDRLERIRAIAGSAEAVPTTISFVDIAGLVEGASRGEGLGNRFLGHVREVDAICHVVRCFDDPSVAHVAGSVDPARDTEVVETELLLKDLETVERRYDEAARAARGGEEDRRAEAALLEALRDHVAGGAPARTFEREGAAALLRELFLLSDKPSIFAANVAEADLPSGGAHADTVRKLAEQRAAGMVVVCAGIEAELAELPPQEREEFMDTLGLQDTGLVRLVRAAYDLLGLVTFFTANANETHTWTVPAGTTAPRAAGQVHTDMERGFIRAQVTAFDDLDELGSTAAVRDAGRVRLEGKDYVVQDGDVIEFRFNV